MSEGGNKRLGERGKEGMWEGPEESEQGNIRDSSDRDQ